MIIVERPQSVGRAPQPAGFSLGSLARRGLLHHWRIHLTVTAGVAAATAVITGALLVGDSVQGTLRGLTLERLGRIDDVLVTPGFFRTQLADDVRASKGFQENFADVVPAILLQGTLENPAGEHHRRAGRVTVVGAGETFWSLGHGGPKQKTTPGQIVLNRPLAAELGVKAGDEMLLRIGRESEIPADSALGRKTETVKTRRLVVSEVIPDTGLGRFALNPTQMTRYAAFTDLSTLQSLLDQPGKVNALLVAGHAGQEPTAARDEALQQALAPTLADYGFGLQRSEKGYTQFTSQRMLLDENTVAEVTSAYEKLPQQPVLTYLANTLAVGDRRIPYSTVAAIDFRSEPPLGPFKTPEGGTIKPLAADEIVLNSWAAEDLHAKPGDTVSMTYFEPESTHGKVKETTVKLRLAAIADLSGAADDPDLTPELRGVTDQKSISDWNPPFPFDSGRIRKKDETYWDEHKATPKAFVSLETGRRLWSSRFGDTTSIRIAAGDTPASELASRLHFTNPSALGFTYLPVKRLGLAASAGATPFNLLFLGLSLFVMAAAVMLVSLLFRLGVERRAGEIGVLASVGFRRATIARLLAGETLVVAAAGALAGLAIGVGYAWLMLVGLRTWWIGAVHTGAIEFHGTPMTFITGWLAGIVVSMLATLWALRSLRRASARQLLAGQVSDQFAVDPARAGRRVSLRSLAAWAMVLGALGLGFVALRQSGEAQAGAFVGAGTLVLVASLLALRGRLGRAESGALVTGGACAVTRLAVRNGERNPTRSTLSIGLIAVATFLIVAMSAFRLDPRAAGVGRDSGSGGFELLAETDQPIYQDLNSKEGREELSLPADAEQALAGTSIYALRLEPGDDASCLNLYQPTSPRVLGVSQAFVERGGFAWAGSAATTDAERTNPWLLLDAALPDEEQLLAKDSNLASLPVPVVLDANTALYSLHKGLGDDLEIRDGRGRPLTVRIVGLLKNSILQGAVVMSEQNFIEHYPDVSGYRFFLVDTAGKPAAAVSDALGDALGDYGWTSERSVDRLASLLEVQNTYLSTFQSLGALGLLLGTFGLATVQLRSVLERRGELALLRAAGFRRARLARLVMLENAALLVAGLGVGVGAALVAVLPHWYAGGASIPWLPLAGTLALVLAVGLAAGLLAVRAVLRAELIPALRGE